MAVSSKDTFEQMVHSVSVQLRSKFDFPRLQAEWFCFRMLAVIKTKYLEGHVPYHIAFTLKDMWKQLGLQREFDLLYSGVQRETHPPTDEMKRCIPKVNTYGLVSVPSGTKGKSRRNN